MYTGFLFSFSKLEESHRVTHQWLSAKIRTTTTTNDRKEIYSLMQWVEIGPVDDRFLPVDESTLGSHIRLFCSTVLDECNIVTKTSIVVSTLVLLIRIQWPDDLKIRLHIPLLSSYLQMLLKWVSPRCVVSMGFRWWPNNTRFMAFSSGQHVLRQSVHRQPRGYPNHCVTTIQVCFAWQISTIAIVSFYSASVSFADGDNPLEHIHVIIGVIYWMGQSVGSRFESFWCTCKFA